MKNRYVKNFYQLDKNFIDKMERISELLKEKEEIDEKIKELRETIPFWEQLEGFSETDGIDITNFSLERFCENMEPCEYHSFKNGNFELNFDFKKQKVKLECIYEYMQTYSTRSDPSEGWEFSLYIDDKEYFIEIDDEGDIEGEFPSIPLLDKFIELHKKDKFLSLMKGENVGKKK